LAFPPALLLRGVTVISATGAAAHENLDVLIRGERIAKIAPHIASPAGARVIDAHDQFLIPGLWDMHVHIWDADRAFPIFIANGVTGVRNMGGHPADLKRWRRELAEGQRLGPRLFACGPVLDGSPPVHPDHSVVVGNATEARSAVDNLKAQGWDFLKVYDNIPRDAYFAIATEAKKDAIPFVGHVPLSVNAIEASDSGQRSIEHNDGFEYVLSPSGDAFRRARQDRIGQPGELTKLPLRVANEINQLADSYDEQRAASFFARLVRNGTSIVPTLSVARAFASIGDATRDHDERLKYVSSGEREAWEHNPIVHLEIPKYVQARKRELLQSLRITGAAHRAGVQVLAGTDSGGVPYLYDGFSLHDELALLVDAGFSPMQALQSATSQAARFLELPDTGSVEVGNRADLILLRADPLADIHNTSKIEAVILGGRFLDRRQLDALLSSAEYHAN
jgi:hypothetical protein